MFDIGWTEMFIVIVVALIVIGPKDLPLALRTVGKWVGKVRAVGRDFQKALDDVVREAELDEVKKQVESVAKLDIKKEIENTVDPTGSMKESLKPIEVPESPKAKKDALPVDDTAKEEPAPAESGAKTGTDQ